MTSPLHQSATIVDKRQLSSHVYQFVFQTTDPIVFSPGQYATFMITDQTRRQYSFAAPSVDPHRFEIVVDVTPMGPGSVFFLQQNIGDTVRILAPLGMFQFSTPIGKTVFVATGTGIVPFRTMIEDYLINGGQEAILLFWGLRHEEDIFWKDLLDRWQASYPNFHYEIVLSKPTGAWQGKTGHVTEYIQADVSFEKYSFYLCGNRHMISDVKTDLLAHRVPEGQIKTEAF